MFRKFISKSEHHKNRFIKIEADKKICFIISPQNDNYIVGLLHEFVNVLGILVHRVTGRLKHYAVIGRNKRAESFIRITDRPVHAITSVIRQYKRRRK